MNSNQVLFLHTNYPAQFRFILKEYLALNWDVYFASHTQKNKPLSSINYIKLHSPKRKGSKIDHQQNISIACFYNLLAEKRKGLNPRRIYVHTGWGLGQFLRDLFPNSKIIAYNEWWFNLNSHDYQFDCTNQYINHTLENRLHSVLRNQSFSLELQRADAIVSPTLWQKKQLPLSLQSKCHVIFDGIDCNMFTSGKPIINDKSLLSSLDKSKSILTYATRGLEPYRGFPEFVSASALFLKKNIDWQVVIAGKDHVNYFKSKNAPTEGFGAFALEQYKEANVSDRVKLLGTLPFIEYRNLLQLSDLHCYFTRPFVLSWSLLESALVGCPLFASKTSPVIEFLNNDKYTNFVDHTMDSELLAEELNGAALKVKRSYPSKDTISKYRMNNLLNRVERSTCISKHMKLADSID
ncbi:glycosyltransferase [Synechococcus sp. UW69]|uniref:glycosyltransferase n=1 Tax=Synechococcus sp. UW69 TaxID=368493 RepID=UPI000E0F95CC|nr:glycosyltransferase [Synechococcus sp. UW69]